MGIVVIGSSFVDIKGFPFEKYMSDGRNAGYIEYVHGGVARNVVEDIANASYPAIYLGIVDDTPLGESVLKHLQHCGVNTEYTLVKKDGMGTWLAVFNEDGDVAGSISKRPDLMPVLDVLNEHGDEIFKDADSVIIELDLEEEIVNKVIELKLKHDTKLFALVSNMSIALERIHYLKHFECFICNQQEIGIFFEGDYEQLSPDQLCDVLSQKIINTSYPIMIVTMGEKGAIYATNKGEQGYCPSHKVDVIDTTGAGDSFCAGVAIGLTYGNDIHHALKLGTAMAANVITQKKNVCTKGFTLK